MVPDCTEGSVAEVGARPTDEKRTSVSRALCSSKGDHILSVNISERDIPNNLAVDVRVSAFLVMLTAHITLVTFTTETACLSVFATGYVGTVSGDLRHSTSRCFCSPSRILTVDSSDIFLCLHAVCSGHSCILMIMID